MAISKVVVVDGNNLTVRIDRGVAGRGVTDVEPVEIDNQLYLEFTFSDGTTETVGPVGTIQYIGESPIVIDGPTISLTTVPVTLGGTNATTAAGAMVNLLPSYTGNANKRLGLNSAASGLEWVTDGGGTVTSVNVSGGTTGLSFTGGPVTTSGTFTLSGTLDVDNGGTGAIDASGARTNLGAAASATTIIAGTGLTGGGDLSANRTLSIANTAVTAGSYGSASNTLSATVNAQGQLTALAATPIAIANTQVSGLGTMSTQNSSAVTITGGSITGITDLAIADGGTGASTAADARSNLGLGTAAVLNAGVANGVATLDAGGTVPLSQIPASIQGGVSYQGSWNAATNTPTIVSSVGTKGHYYVVSVAGSTNINGITDWLPGDWIIFNGSVWEQIDNTDAVASVNGYTGVVVLSNTDVGAPSTSLTISAGTGLSGGGDLTTNRTISIANTAVSAGSYGTASAVPSFTVNGQGQLTAASNTTIAIANTQVSGLGTMSTQNANAVAITGGTATLTSLTVNDNTTLGSSNTDTTTFNARIASEFTPSTANTYDLGRNSHEWRNLYLTGTANISALSTSGAVTLSGGTANGVAYLNGSKVLTTGSALTFDGNKVNTTKYYIAQGTLTAFDAASGGTYLTYGSGVGELSAYSDNSGTAAVLQYTGSYQVWKAGGSEQMRLTSTGLGIGTSSPSTQLQIAGSTFAIMRISAGAGDNNARVDFGTVASPDVGRIGYNNSTNGFTFRTNGSDVMTLDSSGNLGIGTSSFTWLASGAETGINIKSSSSNAAGINVSSSNANNTRMEMFASYTINQGGFYLKGDSAYPNMVFGQVSGSTYRDSMTLDSSGNLGIGTSNPAAFGLFAINGASASANINASTGSAALKFYEGSGTGRGSITSLNGSDGLAFLQGTTEGMRLTSTGLGIGTSSPAAKLDVAGGAKLTGTVVTTTGSDAFSAGAGTGTSIRVNALFKGTDASGNARTSYIGTNIYGTDGSMEFGNNIAGLTMSIAPGGNVGIGTSSPAYKLDVAAGNNARALNIAGATTGYSFGQIANSGGQLVWGVGDGSTGALFGGMTAYASAIGSNNATPFQIATNGTVRATLDTSGNLGLGVTPSAWKSDQRALQIGLSGSVVANTSANNLLAFSNTYFDAGGVYRYITNGFATQYEQYLGLHKWSTAPSGTAGNAISFTQAMTLAASGGLSVGTTTDAGTGNIGLPAGGQLRYSATAYMTPEDNVSGARIVTGGILSLATGGTTVRAVLDASGNLIQTVNTTAATLTTNQTLTFSIVNDSLLRISVRGSDGTTRTATLALT